MLDTVERNAPPKPFRVENVSVMYPIVKGPEVPLNKNILKKVPLKNWNQYIMQDLELTVRINDAKSKSLIISGEPLEGDNPFELYYYIRRDCDRLAARLQEQLMMSLGLPELKSRVEISFPDPAIVQKVTEIMNVDSKYEKWDRSRGKAP